MSTKYIALLRGINVSGHKLIKMAELRDLLEGDEQLEEVQTYIQSGNIVFQSAIKDSNAIEKRITDLIQSKYNFEVASFVSSEKELERILNELPFHEDLSKTYFSFFDQVPSQELITALNAAQYAPEEIEFKGKMAYFYSPNGYGRSKMSTNFLEKKLKLKATSRNWKTTNKLQEMIASS